MGGPGQLPARPPRGALRTHTTFERFPCRPTMTGSSTPRMPAQAEDETVTVDRESVAGATPAPMPAAATHADAPSGPMPVAPHADAGGRGADDCAAAAASRDHQPDAARPRGAAARPERHDARRRRRRAGRRALRAAAPGAGPAPRVRRPRRPRRSTSPKAQGENRAVWGTAMQQQASGPVPTSAATIGNHRAIDALSHVGVRSAVKMPSQRGWRHVIYMLTRINLGLSPDELYEMDLHARIRRNARDSYQIGVFGLKGGVGKTAVTVALGSALSKIRGDRILAVDADPDGGNLADRAGRQSAATVADLLSDKELQPLQRHSRLHEHERLQPRGAVLGGVQRSPPRVQRRRLEGRRRHRVAVLQPGARRLRSRTVPAGVARRAVDGVRSGDRGERVDRRCAAGRGDDGLVAAERISGSARPLVRGDQPRRAGQAEHRRRGSGAAVRTARAAGPRHRAAVRQAHRGGHRDPARPARTTRSERGSSNWPRRCPTTSTGSNGVDHHGRRNQHVERHARPAVDHPGHDPDRPAA